MRSKAPLPMSARGDTQFRRDGAKRPSRTGGGIEHSARKGSGVGIFSAAARKQENVGLKVLFMSGYARNAIVHHGRLDPGVELLLKPFTYQGLAAKIRRVLDTQ